MSTTARSVGRVGVGHWSCSSGDVTQLKKKGPRVHVAMAIPYSHDYMQTCLWKLDTRAANAADMGSADAHCATALRKAMIWRLVALALTSTFAIPLYVISMRNC